MPRLGAWRKRFLRTNPWRNRPLPPHTTAASHSSEPYDGDLAWASTPQKPSMKTMAASLSRSPPQKITATSRPTSPQKITPHFTY